MASPEIKRIMEANLLSYIGYTLFTRYDCASLIDQNLLAHIIKLRLRIVG